MRVYRICPTEYANDLQGTGAYMYGGRWNEKEQYLLYTASYISLATLEVLVNLSYQHRFVKLDYSLVTIDLPDANFTQIKTTQLASNWKNNQQLTQRIGNEFLRENIFIYQLVPSAVIEEENNILINPRHAQFKKVKLVNIKPFNFDKRLLNK